MSLISPVLVSAVKRGGGIVVSAIFGAVFFGEKLEGRKQLLLVVAVGVTWLASPNVLRSHLISAKSYELA